MNNFFTAENIENWKGIILEQITLVGPPILLTLVLVFVLAIVLKATLARLEEQTIRRASHRQGLATEHEKRIRTLFAIGKKVAVSLLWSVGLLIILQLLGVQIGPILAAAGVAGLAISFGAQALVRDLIAGTFILFENQIRVGDVAIINGQGGLVERINLRTVVLRDQQGTVHVFPNGTIDKLSNMTKDWSAFVIDLGVAYKEDPEKVMAVMKRVADEMRQDEEFAPKINDDIEIMGLDNFGDSAIVIKARIKTKPIMQWAVGREYRKRLKAALDAAHIEIPFPHRTLYFGEASPAFQVLAQQSITEEK